MIIPPAVPPQVLAMGDILPGGSVRDPAGRLTLDWLAVYRLCAPTVRKSQPEDLMHPLQCYHDFSCACAEAESCPCNVCCSSF